MTSNEYRDIVTLIDKAIGIRSTSADRVGDFSFRADLTRVRDKAVQEMSKAAARERAERLGGTFEQQLVAS